MFCCEDQTAESSLFYCFYKIFCIKFISKRKNFFRSLCSVIFAPLNVIECIRSKVTECSCSLFHIPELFIVWCCSPGFRCICIFRLCSIFNINSNSADCCLASIFCCCRDFCFSICHCGNYTCSCINRCYFLFIGCKSYFFVACIFWFYVCIQLQRLTFCCQGSCCLV